MQIQISWLLQKPTDLDLHCLQRQDISGRIYPGSAGQGLKPIFFFFFHFSQGSRQEYTSDVISRCNHSSQTFLQEDTIRSGWYMYYHDGNIYNTHITGDNRSLWKYHHWVFLWKARWVVFLHVSTLTSWWKISADNILKYFFLFLPGKRIWHLYKLSLLHEMSNSIF